MAEHFELFDIYKALISIAAGMILGLERELKDKAAGLKTITIICLGSTLFAMLSYKFAGNGDATRIASYIVSGIGFLGAGVIFKVGFNVYGLTTAGIIWMAAAIGMAIGFGAIYLAFTFLISALIVVYAVKLFTKHILPMYHNKILRFTIPVQNFGTKNHIIGEIKKLSREAHEIAITNENQMATITMELHITDKQLALLEDYLILNKDLNGFSY